MDDNFEAIISAIKNSFQPKNVTNETEAEKELLLFLNTRFPYITKVQGHTRTGTRIDIVMEGTYAIELAVVENESRLVTLMDQIIQSKGDFIKMAIILIDLNKIPFEKIKTHIYEFQKLNVTTIIKQTDEEFNTY